MQLILALLVIGGPIAIEVEEVGELEPEVALQVARSVAEAIQTRTSSVVRLEDPIWWGCAQLGQARCFEELQARAQADEIISLRLLGSVQAIRILAQRFTQGAKQPIRSGSLDLPRAATAADGALLPLAVALYPQTSRPRWTVAAPPAPDGPGVLPWVLSGAALAAIGVGSGFALSSLGAKSELEAGPQSFVRYEELSGRFETHRALATGLIITGALAAVSAGVLWWWGGSADLPAQSVDGSTESTPGVLP